LCVTGHGSTGDVSVADRAAVAADQPTNSPSKPSGSAGAHCAAADVAVADVSAVCADQPANVESATRRCHSYRNRIGVAVGDHARVVPDHPPYVQHPAHRAAADVAIDNTADAVVPAHQTANWSGTGQNPIVDHTSGAGITVADAAAVAAHQPTNRSTGQAGHTAAVDIAVADAAAVIPHQAADAGTPTCRIHHDYVADETVIDAAQTNIFPCQPPDSAIFTMHAAAADVAIDDAAGVAAHQTTDTGISAGHEHSAVTDVAVDDGAGVTSCQPADITPSHDHIAIDQAHAAHCTAEANCPEQTRAARTFDGEVADGIAQALEPTGEARQAPAAQRHKAISDIPHPARRQWSCEIDVVHLRVTCGERSGVHADQLQVVRVGDAAVRFHAQERARIAFGYPPGGSEIQARISCLIVGIDGRRGAADGSDDIRIPGTDRKSLQCGIDIPETASRAGKPACPACSPRSTGCASTGCA